MSGSNAISGITIIAALTFVEKLGSNEFLITLVYIAIAFATINIVGGFLVTNRMLEMFRKKMTEVLILLAALFFVSSFKLFTKPSTARNANILAATGMLIELLLQFIQILNLIIYCFGQLSLEGS